MRTIEPLEGRHLEDCLRVIPQKLLNVMQQRYPTPLMVAGGLLRSVVAGEAVRDVDVFVRDEYTASEISSQLYDRIGEIPVPRKTRHAFNVEVEGLSVQLIYKWPFDTHVDLLHQFDFAVCMASLWWGGRGWSGAVDSQFYDDLRSRRLRYMSPDRDENRGGSFLRMLDFVARGYRVDHVWVTT